MGFRTKIHLFIVALPAILVLQGSIVFAQLRDIHVDPFKSGGGSGSSQRQGQRSTAQNPQAPSQELINQAQAGALNDKGMELYRAGDFESAIDYLKAAQKLSPADEVIAYNLSRATSRQKIARESKERQDRDEKTAAAIRADIVELLASFPSAPVSKSPIAAHGGVLDSASSQSPKASSNNSSAFGQAVAAKQQGHAADQQLNGNSSFSQAKSGAAGSEFGGTSFFGQQVTKTSRHSLNDSEAQARDQAGKPWDSASAAQGPRGAVFAGGQEKFALPTFLEKAPSRVTSDPEYQKLDQARKDKIERLNAIRLEIEKVDGGPAGPEATAKKTRLNDETDRLKPGVQSDVANMQTIYIQKMSHTKIQKVEPPPPGR